MNFCTKKLFYFFVSGLLMFLVWSLMFHVRSVTGKMDGLAKFLHANSHEMKFIGRGQGGGRNITLSLVIL
jgi:hypothetical protein